MLPFPAAPAHVLVVVPGDARRSRVRPKLLLFWHERFSAVSYSETLQRIAAALRCIVGLWQPWHRRSDGRSNRRDEGREHG